MPTFDIVCEFNEHEVNNAVDQANREVANRFDFKDAKVEFGFADDKITLLAESEFHLTQMVDIIKNKLTKRGVDLAHVQLGEPVVHFRKAEQVISLQQGIAAEMAKKIIKLIQAAKLKVQAVIQGDKVRVTGKKRDDLQEVIALLKQQETLDLPLQFNNFRD